MDQVLGQDKPSAMLGGEVFTLSPLTLGMMADGARYQKSRPMAEFIQTAKETGLPEKFVLAQLSEMVKAQAADKRPAEEVFGELLQAPNGVLYVIYLMLRKDAPNLTFERVLDWPPAELEKVLVLLPLLGLEVSDAPEKKSKGALNAKTEEAG